MPRLVLVAGFGVFFFDGFFAGVVAFSCVTLSLDLSVRVVLRHKALAIWWI